MNAAYRFNGVSVVDSYGQQHSIDSSKSPIDLNVLAASAKVQSPTVIQLSNSIAQAQQLADTYSLTNQPQLQQHYLQQSYPGISLPVYNPTYLVTQSNHLFNQHKQQLFKPEIPFVSAAGVTAHDAALLQAQSVASPGQIYSAHQDHIKDNSFNSAQSSSSSSAANSPTYERLISSNSPKSNTVIQSIQQQPILSEQEVANLLNYGTLNGHSSPSFYSEFWQAPSSESPLRASIEFDSPTNQQIINDNIIQQANDNVRQQTTQKLTATPTSNYQVYSTAASTTIKPSRGSALDQHQQKLTEHFGDQNTLRIYVPDDDISNVIISQ